jgi:hypothetical protein
MRLQGAHELTRPKALYFAGCNSNLISKCRLSNSCDAGKMFLYKWNSFVI